MKRMCIRRIWNSFGCAFVLLLACIVTSRAQVAPADSLGRDTLHTALPDSVKRVEVIDPVRPFFPTASPFGSIVPSTSKGAARLVSELALTTTRYFTAFDALRRSLPAHPLSQGLPGLVRGFSYAGASPDAVAASYNGRPLEPLAAYGYDLEAYAMEFSERTEIVTGARALLYGTGEALIAVNFVQPRFDVEGSYVRTWYAQDAGDLTGGEIMYSRNVGRRANVAIGFRRLTTGNETSSRFANQEISNWSIHANATWRPSPSLMLSVTELFSNSSRSQNGGLTPTSSLNPLSFAHEVYNSLWAERSLRHDVTLGLEWIGGGRTVVGLDSVLASGASSGRLDSAIRMDASAFASFGRRQFEIGDSVVDIDGGVLRSERLHAGVRAGLWVPLAFARMEVNAIAELTGSRDRDGATQTFDVGRRHIGMLVEMPAGDVISLRASGRYSRGAEGEIGAGAAELVVRPSDRITATLGARAQRHDCPCENPMRLIDSSGTVRYDAYRTSLIGDASLVYQDSSTLVSVSAFMRRARPTAVAAGAADITITGAEARFRIPLWILAVEGHAHGLLLPADDTRAPRLRVFGDLYAPLRLINGNLELRIGTTLEYQTSFAGALYDDVTGAFHYSGDGKATVFQQFPLWDVYAHARIGTAYLRIGFRNILDVEALTIYRYPERGRSFVFEATWTFID